MRTAGPTHDGAGTCVGSDEIFEGFGIGVLEISEQMLHQLPSPHLHVILIAAGQVKCHDSPSER